MRRPPSGAVREPHERANLQTRLYRLRARDALPGAVAGRTSRGAPPAAGFGARDVHRSPGLVAGGAGETRVTRDHRGPTGTYSIRENPKPSAGSQARPTAQRLGRCPVGVRRFESGPAHASPSTSARRRIAMRIRTLQGTRSDRRERAFLALVRIRSRTVYCRHSKFRSFRTLFLEFTISVSDESPGPRTQSPSSVSELASNSPSRYDAPVSEIT